MNETRPPEFLGLISDTLPAVIGIPLRTTLLLLAFASAAAAQNSRPIPELGTPGSTLPPRTFPGAPPAPGAAGASDEIRDPTTGCAVVSMNAEPNVGITWSGDCEHGLAQGKGVLQWTRDGKPAERYEGEMKDGLYEGTGKITYANRARYEGEFKAGERDGRGTYVFPGGGRYTGPFREGRPNGQGAYVWPNGNRYIGEFRDNQRTGRGTLLFADGGRYEGDFVNGKMQGRGLRVWNNGTRYEGDWSNDVANGYGRWVGADGQVFAGAWVNGCHREGSRWATVGVTAQSCGFQ